MACSPWRKATRRLEGAETGCGGDRDVPGRIQVGIELQAAMGTLEYLALPVPSFVAPGAILRRVPCIDELHVNASQACQARGV